MKFRLPRLLRLFRRFGRSDLGTRGQVQPRQGRGRNRSGCPLGQPAPPRQNHGRVGRRRLSGHHALGERSASQQALSRDGQNLLRVRRVLSQQILAPRAFARLRCHVVLALRSKYAVTLYEILEAYVNRRESSLTVSLDEFRSWLKVPEEAYRDWKDLKRNVVLPAVNEINQHGEEGGFFVATRACAKASRLRKSDSRSPSRRNATTGI